ncbi:MAG: methionyl-tRNA formyltransferase [Bacteroides sp.]|nr:methionyl-tRNA formyltransferase [Bacteroides sp.]
MTKQDLKIVFLGTPDFAVESLRRIVDGGYNVVGVVTMPDKPAGRGHKLYQSPVKEFAVEHGLHLMQPVKLKDPAFVDELRSLDADLFVVIAFRMLPEVVWTMPRLGTFNLHASLLPRYRGAAPINWAVINGDTETGVTTFFLKHEIDTGDIIAQEKVEILPTDNVGDVHDRLMELGAELTIKTIDDIIAGTLTTIPQEQLIGDTEPTPAPKIFKETCRIDWNLSAERIHNLVRGLSPYPAAWTTLMDGGTEVGAVKVFETRIVKSHVGNIPGEIIIEGDTLTVGCGNGEAIEILSLQAPGKRRMPTPDFLRGSRLVNPKFI